jgi:hypothetical protein
MISIIHNTYDKNIYVRESAILNIKALEESGIDYQYIIFNDKGDSSIYDDIKDLINDKVEYHYSDFNFGLKLTSGGWTGAIPLLKGEYIHNIGQDDVFTCAFYQALLPKLEDPNIYLAYSNGFVVNSALVATGQFMGPFSEIDYSSPRKIFDLWFQRKNNTLTAANNYIPAPGVIYKKVLHELIGPPDIKSFKGSADFEYWARILFNNLGVHYNPKALWLYRMSEYSYGSKSSANTDLWNSLIKEKYQHLITSN